jgi:hypothetical protein
MDLCQVREEFTSAVTGKSRVVHVAHE